MPGVTFNPSSGPTQNDGTFTTQFSSTNPGLYGITASVSIGCGYGSLSESETVYVNNPDPTASFTVSPGQTQNVIVSAPPTTTTTTTTTASTEATPPNHHPETVHNIANPDCPPAEPPPRPRPKLSLQPQEPLNTWSPSKQNPEKHLSIL